MIKKILFVLLFLSLTNTQLNSDSKINSIIEGSADAKVKLIVYESLTCTHCATFHEDIYPNLKKDFIDKGLVKIEFKNFPLDLAAFNASKIAHCRNDGKPEILHFLFNNQKKWAHVETLEEANNKLIKILKDNFSDLDFKRCTSNKQIEDHILEDRINGVKKFKINATPTLIINEKKFDNPLDYEKLKKTLKKMI
tara:strand:- start:1227 stop:1811 length:585 start_codon:yes stop_codon:yes gene_type:complete